MNELKIILRDDQVSFRPGETVEGVAGWRCAIPLRAMELRLFWFTRGKGTADIEVVNRLRFEPVQAEEGRRFSFVLPPEPYSFSGQLVSLVWALELVADPGEEAVRVEITVSPTGKEMQLHAYASAR